MRRGAMSETLISATVLIFVVAAGFGVATECLVAIVEHEGTLEEGAKGRRRQRPSRGRAGTSYIS